MKHLHYGYVSRHQNRYSEHRWSILCTERHTNFRHMHKPSDRYRQGLATDRMTGRPKMLSLCVVDTNKSIVLISANCTVRHSITVCFHTQHVIYPYVNLGLTGPLHDLPNLSLSNNKYDRYVLTYCFLITNCFRNRRQI